MNGWIAVWAWPNLNRDWENNGSNTQDIDLSKMNIHKGCGFLAEREGTKLVHGDLWEVERC